MPGIIRGIVFGAFRELFDEKVSEKLAKLEEFKTRVETILDLEDNGVDETFPELASALGQIVSDRVVEELEDLKSEIVDVAVGSSIEAKDAILAALNAKKASFMGDRSMSERMLIQGLKAIAADYISKNATAEEKAAFIDKLITADTEDVSAWIRAKISPIG